MQPNNRLAHPAAVYHSRSARRSLSAVPLGALEISIARDRIAFMLMETTGNVWLADLGTAQ